jgi:transcription antitermination factor NusG
VWTAFVVLSDGKRYYKSPVRDVGRFRKVMAKKYEFSKGESVRIKVGVFRAFIGKVSEIHKEKSTLTVNVEVSGKLQSIEFTFLEVEKLDPKISTH